jgi:glycerol kinase
LATGVWSDLEALRANWRKDAEWRPAMAADVRERAYSKWKKAVQRTLDWIDDEA